MKKKNGFTLIELLAIIVILAIIAVITVPIILNIIDSSKKGAVKDSAYGYKDAVNKFYVSKLSQDKNYTIPNNSYATTTLKNLGVTVSGQEPGTNSWVTIENNNVVAGCLQFDEYKVEIKNSVIGETKNGECIELQIPSCPGCLFTWYTSSKYIKGTTGKTDAEMKLDGITTTDDYTTLNKNVFLGVVLDNDGKIERAFACGIRTNQTTNEDTPFCIEGTGEESIFEKNKSLLIGENLWNGTCSGPSNALYCNGQVSARIGTDGTANTYSSIGGCSVYNNMSGYTFNDGYVGCVSSS